MNAHSCKARSHSDSSLKSLFSVKGMQHAEHCYPGCLGMDSSAGLPILA